MSSVPSSNFQFCAPNTKSTTQASSKIFDSSHLKISPRTPVYFLGIGGPNFMENTHHPAHAKLAAVGWEITTKAKPKAVIVFSAHWQGGPNNIKINVAEQTDIIYDFYGFPPHYYEYEETSIANIEVERVERGLDHGVWVGFVAAFDPKKNLLSVLIVQVLLYNSEDPDQHYRVGQALEGLRDEGILIISTGMAVHNLRDFRAMRGTGENMPYAYSFNEALKEAVTTEPKERQGRISALLRRSDARKAHPTLEHILPIYFAAGAAGLDLGERLWTFPEGSLSWAQYRFGDVVAA
ncbi:Extradiol ring-cleavage dioxygenase, class III enzyme, subunit B [Tricladium varicosporioides]|nr:Extradiol ring-cleavage dioxygenase, class III enzyme, subunit B [Hymenoscyphus varicosporioides]